MITVKYFLILWFFLLLCSIQPTLTKAGRRGGGSRGGGGRGSSSSGSRGRGSSSSSSSSSQGSSSSGTQWDRSGSKNNKPSPSKPPVGYPQPVKPSAPELPKVNSPSPKLPDTPGHSQPSNPYPYNPNYPQQGRPAPGPVAPQPGIPSQGSPVPGNVQPYPQPGRQGPGPSVPQGNPPPYGSGAPGSPGNPPPYPHQGSGVPQGNPPPYGTHGNPPPYAPGNPPPYAPGNPPPYPHQGTGVSQGSPSPHGNPPPYPHQGPGVPQGNPPPYGTYGNPPPYAPGNPPPYPHQGSGVPQGNPPPYGAPGNYPPPPFGTNPGLGSQPSASGNRPNLPLGNPPPYGVNLRPGSQGYPPSYGQPSYSPYPRQPGIVYPQGGVNLNNYQNYYGPGGFQGSSSIKPHKKKGLLGGLLSFGKSSGKKPKHHGIGSPQGSFGGHGISPVNMVLPAMAMKKSHKSKSFFKPSNLLLAYGMYRLSRFGGIDLDGDDYDRRCFRPRPPINGSVACEITLQGLLCRATCLENYTFPDNTTTLTAQCWRFSGHWNRTRYFPPCKPKCDNGCQNGGKCIGPGVCRCEPEYRGDQCQYNIMNCDVTNLSHGSNISWVCSHKRNETVCTVNCKSPLVFESPAAEQYHCHMNGTWTPDTIPVCVAAAESTESPKTTALPTITTQEG